MSRGEFQLIDEFVAAFAPARGAVRIGPGDDCAVLRPSNDELCVTTDAVVEGVHFTRPYFSFEDIGHKALAVNLSDLAAMGAKPEWFLCSLAMPKPLSAAQLAGLARGMANLARRFGCVLAGGNVTKASELSVTMTAAGSVPRGQALLRSGARAGDFLYVSGTLGEAALALAQQSPGPNRQKRPEPKVALGLLARRYATAAVDVSDGLMQDLGHVMKASAVDANVNFDAVPMSAAVRRAGRQLALYGGEDYELLLAIPPRKAAAFEKACARAGEKVIRVGELLRGKPSRLREGPAGHDHFVDPPGRRD